ncbi:YlbF family regulator [Streptococcus sp.]|nr:YlbF family regulator [Streptococcus sp.]MDY3823627.1 YlbF family regulator [Streptococcus sp.]
MLEINQELIEIDDAIDALVASILETKEVKNYKKVKTRFQENTSLQEKLQLFSTLNQDFENQKAYLPYREDLKVLKKEWLLQKRQLDLDPLVQEMRQAEHDLQVLLSTVSHYLAKSVSEDIFVDEALPLSPHRRPHAKGHHIRERNS